MSSTTTDYSPNSLSSKKRRITRKVLHRLRCWQRGLIVLCAVVGTQLPVSGYYGFPPAATNDWTMLLYTETAVIDVLANDVGIEAPIDPTTVTIVTQPEIGTVSVDPVTGEVTYVPDGNWTGWDLFEYTVKDTLGQVSNVARVNVTVLNFKPSIVNFIATPGSGYVWTFSGTVFDEDPDSATVTLSGSVTKTGIPVNADGSFSYSLIYDDPNGLVHAVATDEFGLESDQVSTWIFNY